MKTKQQKKKNYSRHDDLSISRFSTQPTLDNDVKTEPTNTYKRSRSDK